MLLAAICVLVLGGILVAGLWPFHAPRNDVRLVGGRKRPTVRPAWQHCQREFFSRAVATTRNQACSFEIWLQPLTELTIRGRFLRSIILGRSDRSVPVAAVAGLIWRIYRAGIDASGRERTSRIYVDDVFRASKPVFVSITSGGGGLPFTPTARWSEDMEVSAFPAKT